MKKRLTSLILVAVILVSCIPLCLTSCGKKKSEYDENGRMILNLRNLYFNDWTGSDTYTQYVEDKFGVSINASSYSWADWDSQVYGPVNGDNLTDVFHFDLDSYNFSNSYVQWAKGGVTKALPDDLSKWPNLQNMLSTIDNLDSLKYNGKLYCIPVVKNIESQDSGYSPFTYVYRRDWAKDLGVYQEGDVYTWEQFLELLNAFYNQKTIPTGGNIATLADVEWAYPSVINYYKTAPHCYTLDENGNVVSNFATDDFLEGLGVAKNWTLETKYYWADQYSAKDGDASKQYAAGRVGVFYENLSLTNYTTLRKNMSKVLDSSISLDDATAIMKIIGPDGNYVLEGTENWFSATFFSADISDEKMEKILDILDWLLSEEGTEMAAYGFEGYDYLKDEDGNITLTEEGWEKDMDGNYVEKFNGVKYLRYMATLGYDLIDKDPLIDQEASAILNDWYDYMDTQKAAGKLTILKEDSSVKWLTSSLKAKNSGSLLSAANTAVIQYVYGKISLDSYLQTVNSKTWEQVLQEINNELNK